MISANYYQDNIKDAVEWIKAEPNSPLGYIYYAIWARAHAWRVRGQDYVANTPEKNIKNFGDLSVRNINFLVKHHDVASNDPFFYYIMLMTLSDLGLEEESLKVYQEGIEKFPKQRVIYNTFMYNFEQKWFGVNYPAVKMIIDDIQRLNPTDKDFYYYHIMYSVNNNNYDLNKLDVDWDRVEQGAVNSLEKLASLRKIEDIKKLYCSYLNNKQRLERLLYSFKQGQLDNKYIENSLNNCQT